MTKQARWEFVFEFPDEMTDAEITGNSAMMVLEALRDNKTRPEITTVDPEWNVHLEGSFTVSAPDEQAAIARARDAAYKGQAHRLGCDFVEKA